MLRLPKPTLLAYPMVITESGAADAGPPLRTKERLVAVLLWKKEALTDAGSV